MRQPQRHWLIWAGVALVFAALVASRVMGIEEHLRDLLREGLRADQIYSERRSFQRPLAAAALAAGALFAGFMLWRETRAVKGRRNLALLVAMGSAMVMVLLIVLRIISLHQVDSLLYGPLKLNWVIDLGTTALVLGSAVLYLTLVRSRP
ncbi:MAG: hypothetical protein HC870_00155 [Rhizobiales bacterium]|nr:hypothetical protein [Hyphomicrobiales bacterium]